MAQPVAFDREAWIPPLAELSSRVVRAAHRTLASGAAPRRPVGQGVADATYAVDAAAELEVERWFEEAARRGPLSLFSEDAGWRHGEPRPGGGWRERGDGDHGGPRLVIDPIDGTRNLMSDLRSGWCALALCPPGTGEPRLADVTVGWLEEIATTRQGVRRRYLARAGAGALRADLDRAGDSLGPETPLRADADRVLDHGYYPYFRYAPDMRPALPEIEGRFFARLASAEGADVRNCWDDQYICSAGQLALLAEGVYRFVADLRPLLAARRGRPTQPSKPYDVAAALLVAREAGCPVVDPADPGGGPVDAPLDAVTPVGFVGFHNETTRACLWPLLAAELHDGEEPS